MNNINRALVKSQAREIIKGKVFLLFIISMIVSLLTSGGMRINLDTDGFDEIKDWVKDNVRVHAFDDDYDDDFDDDDYDDFFEYFGNDGLNDSDNPIEGFGSDASIIGGADSPTSIITHRSSLLPIFTGFASLLADVVALVFAPLQVTLCGIYLSLIRRNPMEELRFGDELGGLFKNSFNPTFVNKLVLVVLRELFTALWSLLFIIPGIVYHYGAYFSFQIMNDNPNLKPTEALELSKKMVKGNRGELFILDLSFIAWGLLCLVTFGIAAIYVVPYIQTTQALYYENFRLRALADGRICDDDFLSAQERFHKYNQPFGAAQQQAAGGYCNNTQQNQNVYYTPDFNNAPAEPPQQTGYYYPPQPVQPQAPEYYQPPVNPEPTEPAQTDYSVPEDTDNNE